MRRVTDSRCARPPRQGGFTLLELMITLAVAGVLVGIAVPNMRTFSQNNQLTAVSNDLLRSLQVARSEAIKRQRDVVVCASSDPTNANPQCSYGEFTGWIVFQDTNRNWQADGMATEPVLEQHQTVDPTVIVRTDFDGIESYNQSGFANPTAAKRPTRNIVVCDKRGTEGLIGTNSTGRAVLITPTGRARVTRDPNEVNDAVSAVGSACP